MLRLLCVSPVWLALIVACGGDDAGVVARFALPGAEADFYALPFPNDLRRDADGTLDLAEHPRPNQLTGDYLDAIDERVSGFSLSPVVFFRFGGAIDVASLPATPQASVDSDASVYLVGIDPEGADLGRRIPVNLRFEPAPGEVIEDNWLAVQTYPGFVLEEERRYAVIVTDRVLAGGQAIGRDRDFETVMAGDAAAEVSAVYDPLRDFLDSSSSQDPAEAVVSAAVFTTQNATGLLRDARTVVRAQPAPVPAGIELRTSSVDYALYEGTWEAPNFQRGDAPYRRDGGDIEVGSDGLPVVQRSESLRFALSVPLGEPPANGWPVILYAHGTGGSYLSFDNNNTSRRMAQAGLAVLSMDQVLHGPRDPSGTSPELTFFNFLNPLAARDNTLQGAIDLFNLTRLAEVFDYQDVDNARHVFFDSSQMMFFGHSQGGITGMPFLGIEPEVGAAILSGSGGLLYLGLLLKTEPIDITALIATIIRDEPLDAFNPVLTLLQTYLDRADAINYARYVIDSPPAGGAAKDVLLGEGFTDRYTPIPTIEALALALGLEHAGQVIEPIAGLEVAGSTPIALPVTDNLGNATGAVVQYAEATGSDGHFIFFDIQAAAAQSVEFLRSRVETGSATLIDP